jgi:hypothetical protein
MMAQKQEGVSYAMADLAREPALDAVELAADVVEPQVHRGKIHLHAGDAALDNAEPGDDLIELMVDAVEPIVEPGEAAAQKIQDLGVFSLGHG